MGTPMMGDKGSAEWKQVEIKFVRDFGDAVLALSGVHLMTDPPPLAICVDDVDVIVGHDHANLARLMAALQDARVYCSNRVRKVMRKEKACTSVVCFSSSSFSPQWGRIVSHWIPSILTITSHRNQPHMFQFALESPQGVKYVIVYSTSAGAISFITIVEA